MLKLRAFDGWNAAAKVIIDLGKESATPKCNGNLTEASLTQLAYVWSKRMYLCHRGEVE
jgi:hypothetical protein